MHPFTTHQQKISSKYRHKYKSLKPTQIASDHRFSSICRESDDKLGDNAVLDYSGLDVFIARKWKSFTRFGLFHSIEKRVRDKCVILFGHGWIGDGIWE
jgi:hypothetical protein